MAGKNGAIKLVAGNSNPALAEALSHVELEHAIPETLYRAVAEVLAFILRASGKLA